MKNTRLLRWTGALVTALTFAVVVPPAASQDGPTSVADAKEERAEARAKQLEAAAKLSLVEAEDLEIVSALDAATELVNLQQAKVDAAEQRLEGARDARRQAEVDLETAGTEIDAVRQAALDYAVTSYIGRDDRRVEAWFDAADATQAAHKVALLDTVGTDTVDLIDQLRALESTRTTLLADAEAAQVEADAISGDLAGDLVDLEAKQDAQIALKAELEVRRARLEAALAEAEQEEADLQAFIVAEKERVARELEEARAAALAAVAASSAPSAPSAPVGAISLDGWTWPTGGGVGSGYGMRLHPVLGYYRLHSGVDIGGAQGQPIWAANEGIVVLAAWNGGYGNAVVIQHADSSVTTLYGHMSAVAVGVGDYVTSGQVVGYVGSTGLSTGPHLHFEVRINGVPVDPLSYLP